MVTMRYFSDGHLFALLDGADLCYLTAFGSPVFLHLQTHTHLACREEEARLRFCTPAGETYAGTLEMEDFVADGCYHRQIRTTSSLTFSLSFPPYCHVNALPLLKINGCPTPSLLIRIPVGTPTPDGKCSQKEYRLLLSLTGQCHFSPDKKEIRLQAGHSSLYCCLCPGRDLTENLEYYLEQTQFGSPIGSSLYANRCAAIHTPHVLSPAGKRMWQVLTSLLADGGGVIGGHGEHACYPSDMVAAGQAFLHFGHLPKAERIATALLEQLNLRGYIPLCFAADNPYSAAEKCGAEQADYPEIANFFLDLAIQTETDSFKKRLRREAKNLLCHATRALRPSGQLGFSGSAFPMRQSMIPADRVLYGNMSAGAEYIYLQKRLGSVDAASYQLALATHIHDFENTSTPFVESRNRLGRMRLPAGIYATCPACVKAPYTGWLTKGQFGSYLCPACLEKGVKEQIELDCPPFPGLYATAAERLYRAKIKTRAELVRTTENALTYCDKNTPFFDLCLMAGVLGRLDSPHYPHVMKMLDDKIEANTFPFYAYEASVYLLACKTEKRG